MNAVPSLQSLSETDRLIHEPARLMILSILAGADAVEFRYVQELTGLSRGNLFSHMSKLEAAGLVIVEKAFRGKMPVTTLRFTRAGRKALNDYRERLTRIVAGVPGGRAKR